MSVIRAEMTPFRFARDMRTERRTGVTMIVLLLTLNTFFFWPSDSFMWLWSHCLRDLA